MSKKKNKKTIPALDNSGKQQDSSVIIGEIAENEVPGELKVPKKETKQEPKQQKQTKVKKEKKPNKLGRKLKETFSELKKVSWPTFPKVVKQTCVVLGVVVFFGLVLFGFDYILKFMFKLLNGVSVSGGELWGSVGILVAIVLIVVVSLTIWLVKKKRKGSK